MTDKKRKVLTGLVIAVFIMFSVALCWFIGRPLAKYAANPEMFREWIDSFGAWGKLAFVGMVALQVIVALIPGEPLEIGAGYAFGAVEGTLLCMAGAALGGTIVYWFVKKCGIKAVEVFFPKEKIESLKFMRNSKRLNVLAFFIYVIPGTPKDILTYCIGLTPMKYGIFMLISTIGRIPSIVTSTIGGNAVCKENWLFAAVFMGATLLISVIGLLIYRRISRNRG